MPFTAIREFLRLQSAAGIVLVTAAGIAIALANSPWSTVYTTFFDTRVGISIDERQLAKPLLLWINDGLMAIFFLLVGLEIKREALVGELAGVRKAALPVVAAFGGMAAPALVYSFLNWGDAHNMRGWAIPTATDIAFALGVLSLLGERVPPRLKVFLLALAIIDDLGAIVIIALFYTAHLSVASLALAAIALAVLLVLNRRGVETLAPYVLTGIFLWACVLESGVHATLAGVALACAIPIRRDRDGTSMLERLEHALHPWVSYGIMPIFAFANAGVSLAGLTPGSFLDPLPLGIAAGLFLGKQAGVMAALWLSSRIASIPPPEGTTWVHIYGTAVLTGIGFTMSLFIGTLAFDDAASGAATRIGVIGGSLCSAFVGFLILRFAPEANRALAPASR